MKYLANSFRHVWPAYAKRIARRQSRKQERRAGKAQCHE